MLNCQPYANRPAGPATVGAGPIVLVSSFPSLRLLSPAQAMSPISFCSTALKIDCWFSLSDRIALAHLLPPPPPPLLLFHTFVLYGVTPCSCGVVSAAGAVLAPLIGVGAFVTGGHGVLLRPLDTGPHAVVRRTVMNLDSSPSRSQRRHQQHQQRQPSMASKHQVVSLRHVV